MKVTTKCKTLKKNEHVVVSKITKGLMTVASGNKTYEFKMSKIHEFCVAGYHDSNDWLRICDAFWRNGGGMLLGRAGTGKSYVAKQSMIHLKLCGKKVNSVAFTNKATIQLNGSTIHRFLKIDKAGKIDRKWAMAQRYDMIFVDEISMIGSHLWKLLCEFKMMTGVKFVLIGDYRQLPPVEEDTATDWFNHPTIKWLAGGLRCELGVMKRYDIKLWDLLEDVWAGKYTLPPTQFYDIDDLINGSNICYLNESVNKINRLVQKHVAPADAVWVKYETKRRQSIAIFVGAKLIMNVTTTCKTLKKNEPVVVSKITKGLMTVASGNETYEFKMSKIHEFCVPGYATTIHKSQGDTVQGSLNIFDTGFMKQYKLIDERNCLYTALSRATSLDNIKIRS